MSGRGPSFIGLQSDLVVSTKQLWEFRIPYMPGWNDPPDRHAMVALTPKLKGVFELAPRMNVKYSQFVKGGLGTYPKRNTGLAEQVQYEDKKTDRGGGGMQGAHNLFSYSSGVVPQ